MLHLPDVFANPKVDELLLNGATSAWLHGPGYSERFANPFPDNLALIDWIQHLALRSGVRLDPLYPANGGMLPEGDIRWHCILPPASPAGPLVSFRRHRFAHVDVQDFLGAEACMEQLASLMQERLPILVCGPTGAGKTTFLASLLQRHCHDERVAILEHLTELPLASEQWVRLVERSANLEGVGGIGLDRLFEEALRLRPDRFVIGEIRGREAPVFVKSLLAGHGGSLATLHAVSSRAAIQRLTSLCQSYDPSSAANDYQAILGESNLHVVILARGAGRPEIKEITSCQR